MTETPKTSAPDFRTGFPARDLRDGNMISGHANGAASPEGSDIQAGFNEGHILAITKSIRDYRRQQNNTDDSGRQMQGGSDLHL